MGRTGCDDWIDVPAWFAVLAWMLTTALPAMLVTLALQYGLRLTDNSVLFVWYILTVSTAILIALISRKVCIGRML